MADRIEVPSDLAAAHFCDAGLMWFLPCSQAPTRLAIQGRRTRFDQLRKVPVCGGHAGRIRQSRMPLWIIRDLPDATP